jgi:transposase
LEFGTPIYFENTKASFGIFLGWIQELQSQHDLDKVIIRMEPTDHYWLNLAHYLNDHKLKFVVVNPTI